MKIKVIKIEETSIEPALFGLSLNKKQPLENMYEVAKRLCDKDKGHNKFLEHIVTFFDITAPRFFWQEFDTFRIGVSKQSESTMHTILKDGKLTPENFDDIIPLPILDRVNQKIVEGDLLGVKNILPEGFLQRREVMMSYKTIRHINVQRFNHRLHHWQEFLKCVKEQLDHPELIWKEETKDE
jgi:hypothetical protein